MEAYCSLEMRLEGSEARATAVGVEVAGNSADVPAIQLQRRV